MINIKSSKQRKIEELPERYYKTNDVTYSLNLIGKMLKEQEQKIQEIIRWINQEEEDRQTWI